MTRGLAKAQPGKMLHATLQEVMVNATVVADPKHIADGHNYVLEMSLQLCERRLQEKKEQDHLVSKPCHCLECHGAFSRNGVISTMSLH